MAFYKFQLSTIAAQNIRSRVTDLDLFTFGVLVNGRDQGHGYAYCPVFPGTVLAGGKDIDQGADNNGLRRSANHMSPDWVIGPLEIASGDTVSIVYTATNTSDSEIATSEQQAVDEWTVKAVDVYYSLLLGAFVSGLGLEAVQEFIGTNFTEGAGAFLADPVGSLLGIKPEGPCNGVVYADAKSFTGATLAQLSSDSSSETSGNVTMPAAVSTLTQHYSDAATHNAMNCGATAETDVTVIITRFENFSVRFQSNVTGGSISLRGEFPNGGSVKELFGLRI